MGKMAYIATAILVGIVAMLPVMMLTPKGTDQSYYTLLDPAMSLESRADVESLWGLEGAETVVAPSTPFHVGVILAFSLVSASGVYFYFKKKRL